MKKILISLFLILALLLCGCGMEEISQTAAATVPVSGDSLTVHFLDAGQADCTLLECGGKYMLLNGGIGQDAESVVSYLWEQGVRELSAVICTHANEEYAGGVSPILAEFPVETLYIPADAQAAQWQEVQNGSLQPGDVLFLNWAEITALGPADEASLVLRVEYGESSFLFVGVGKAAAENDMPDFRENAERFDADVLKVCGQDADTSGISLILNAADPDYGVISAGGDVCGEVLEEAGVTVFRTDRLGTVAALADGKEITFTWTVRASASAAGK